MTETDHCAENALAERVNGILKSEYGLGYVHLTAAGTPPLRPAMPGSLVIAYQGELPGVGTDPRVSAASQPTSSPLAKKSISSASARCLSSARTPREVPFCRLSGSSRATSARRRW